MGYELYSDILRNELMLIFVVNIGLFLIAIIPLILTYTKVKTEYLTISFISIGSLLLIYNWIISGGIAGVSEYNMFVLVVLSGMILRGNFMKGFIMILIVVEILVLYLMEFRTDLFTDIILKITLDERYYLLLMPACTIVFLYLRYSYDEDENKLLRKINELKAKVEEINTQNSRIELKKKEYQNINSDLAKKIQLRKTQLEDRNKSVTSFIKLSLRELYPPLQATFSSIKQVTNKKEGNDIYEMMSKSGDHLIKAYQKMTINMRNNLN